MTRKKFLHFQLSMLGDKVATSKLSPKQELYYELLRIGLVYIRNQQSLPFWRRWRDTSVYEEAELVHNLLPDLSGAEFADHDVWFLNVQAQSYQERAASSPLYSSRLVLIRKLFDLVPEHLRSQLDWTGPSACASIA